ncbi:SLC13 family permease [Halobaculum roseum]|uniref:SLC13 family permease n=1 Tax=Halobaculum roseum TaxID=2175149 RepID=A0ABD5MQJ5_9EURY|nr:SLC13 family permease [Halobaculum roseum]QZY04501.1 anion permease [Halobaculum roseum]
MTGRRVDATIVAVAVTAAGVVALGPGEASVSQTGRYVLATGAFAAILWVTEALPLPVTALCIPTALTVFGVYPTLGGALVGFADPVLALLLAGFVLAAALSKHDIDRRIAYRLVARIGTSPRRLVLALMIATAGLSMLISNTATTAMMVPVALGVARTTVGTPLESSGTKADGTYGGNRIEGRPSDGDGDSPTNIETAALLGTAYAASIGGVGTLIGSPPNAIVVSQLSARLGYDIGFAEWLIVGLPLVAVSLPIAWYLLAVRIYPPEAVDATVAREHARERLASLGPVDPAGRRVVIIAAATAGLWLLGGADFLFEPMLPDQWYTTLFGGAGRSVFGLGHQGVLYYVIVGLVAIPVLFVAGTVEWDDVQSIDWGTLILLGGGLSLADALARKDAVSWLADTALEPLVGVPIVVLVFVIVVATILVGELASNTAMAAVLAPVLIDIGPHYADALGTTGDLASVLLVVTGGVAASSGFALPVATPPNAIAFGTGRVGRVQMLRAGSALDVVLAVVVTVVLLALFLLVWPYIG